MIGSASLSLPGLTRRLPWRWLALFTIAVTLALALSVGMDHPVQNNNEGLYASIARDMLASGSWVVPKLDGVPYLEKPPLLYWITAISYAIFGVSEVSTRAAPIVGLLLMLSAICWFARREWGERSALIAMALAVSAPLMVVMERMLMFDLLFTGFYTWCLVAMYEAMVRGAGRRWMLAAYAALALAVLTKGLVAIVLVGAIGLGLVLSAPAAGRRARLRLLFDPLAIALFAAIAVPWHVAAWLEEPRFGWFYFVNEHILRFLDRREPRDYYHGPWWYYLPRTFAALLPWAALAFVPAPASAEDAPARRFLWLAFVLPLAFFSLSSAKANYYMVVVVPAAALLLARRVERLGDSRWLAVVPATSIAVFVALGIAGARIAAPNAWPHSAPVLVMAALMSAIFSLLLVAMRRPVAAVLASAVVALPLAQLFSDYLKVNEGHDSARRIAGELQARGLDQVYLFRDFESLSALAYYVPHPVGVIDSQSNDLWFGTHLHPDVARFPTLEQFLAGPRRGDVGIVVSKSRRGAFEASALGREFSRVASTGAASVYAPRSGWLAQASPKRSPRTR